MFPYYTSETEAFQEEENKEILPNIRGLPLSTYFVQYAFETIDKGDCNLMHSSHTI